jgi:hypothetical protein
VSEPKKPLEQVLDLFVYAPLGFLMNADEVIPNLIERGRQQVTMARMFGQMAVKQGQVEASKAANRLQDQATEVVGQLSNRGGGKSAAAPAPAAAPVAQAAAPVAETEPAEPAPGVDSLAIPDYDSLSASQVVPRLDGLSKAELDSVRAYESANRGRKTILSKISALPG